MKRNQSHGKAKEDGEHPDGNLVRSELIALLTPREIEVLGWLIEGKRDGEIASILAISVYTVSKHVQHILHKLEVETRTAAARTGIESGITRGR